MKKFALIAAFGVALAGISFPPAQAEPGAAALGASLTPVGAERQGNAEGTIPEWTGGIAAAPAGWKAGDPRPDPYGDDKPLFVIDGSNAEEHAGKLSAGQLALLKRYEGYTMPVYPSRRSCAYPESVYQATKANVGVAAIDSDGKLLAGKGGFLFPLPETGAEVVWNHLIRYQGVGSTGRLVTASPKKDSGNFALGLLERTSYSRFHDPALPDFASMENVGGEQITEILSPTQIAGSLMLIREAVNGDRETWRYMPGQRRVRRLPDFRYDNPIVELDGLIVADQANMFNGQLDRYDWKLIGKQELYIAYNDAKLNDKSVTYAHILQPKFPARDVMRYELHRVWKTEATLRAGLRHLYNRRVLYSDEDSWIVAATELYDGRGELWRVQEGPIGVVWELPACINRVQFHFDLNANRYVAAQLRNEERPYDYLAGQEGRIDKAIFKPDYLRLAGRR
ncbi:DUF1329 domain-containing protein [Parvibaculum sp.]|uniref:DUF1329 domain-containing protein n=1 Tax=Parvibaculum sp. TaxID=2024848 RepID=UPI001B10B26B|nr:DUF1329 domain-containing protein [Parvibaculum sp.]MBO6635834.1 DUF1329 domain-containing protein [Parvibaculum sp.]MBO6678249.1 DUF1329 domain-containing protein [Parvibaculum sp.]MBO6685781.1 DUF1329 domain-containing protein [Parvibaculum sp.]MBO6903840.1 DUF1329 domain-containing protein [Parvibaculum sp.]